MASAIPSRRAAPRWWRGAARPRSIAFAAYRVSWIVLFATGLFFAGFGSVLNELSTQRVQKAGAQLGMAMFLDGAIDGLLFGPLGVDGRRIGFRNGDLLVTVDGRRLPRDFEAAMAAIEGPAGSVAALGVRRPDGSVARFRVARDPDRLRRGYAGWGLSYGVRRWIAFGFTLLAMLAGLLVALLLFLRRPRDPVAQMLSFSLVLRYGYLGLVLPSLPLIVYQLQYVLATLLLTSAVLLFPDGRLRGGWAWTALVAEVLKEAVYLWTFVHSAASGWSQPVAAAAAATLLMAAVARLRHTPAGIARQQTKWVLFGIVVFCLLQMANASLVALQSVVDDVGPSAWIVLFSHLTGQLAQLALPAGLLVSLLRFRLYDTERAISRSVALGALTVILLAVFTGSEKIIEALGEEYLGGEFGAMSGALAAAIAAVTISPLHHRVSRWAERRFQGDLVHLRQSLPTLVADLRETVDPPTLGRAVLARVDPGVRAIHGVVTGTSGLVATHAIDPEAARAWLATWQAPEAASDRLSVDRGDPVFPLRLPLHAEGIGLAGWLLLGPRPDGSFYGRDERDALLALGDPIARALAITTAVQAREAAVRHELERLAGRQTALERAVDQLAAGRRDAGRR